MKDRLINIVEAKIDNGAIDDLVNNSTLEIECTLDEKLDELADELIEGAFDDVFQSFLEAVIERISIDEDTETYTKMLIRDRLDVILTSIIDEMLED